MLQKSTESSGDESEEYEQVEEVLGLDVESDEEVDGDNEDDNDEVELAGEILVFCLHVYYKQNIIIYVYMFTINKI